MAKIYGIELKNIKSFNGVEGKMYQANIYLDGKRIGYWSQDSWGGEDIFEFEDPSISVRKFNDLLKKICPKVHYLGSELDYSLDLLMEDIINLNSIEKSWKKKAKCGHPILMIIDFPDKMKYQECSFSDGKDLKKEIDLVKSEVEKDHSNENIKYYFFEDDHDFDIGKHITINQIAEMKEGA